MGKNVNSRQILKGRKINSAFHMLNDKNTNSVKMFVDERIRTIVDVAIPKGLDARVFKVALDKEFEINPNLIRAIANGNETELTLKTTDVDVSTACMCAGVDNIKTKAGNHTVKFVEALQDRYDGDLSFTVYEDAERNNNGTSLSELYADGDFEVFGESTFGVDWRYLLEGSDEEENQ